MANHEDASARTRGQVADECVSTVEAIDRKLVETTWWWIHQRRHEIMRQLADLREVEAELTRWLTCACGYELAMYDAERAAMRSHEYATAEQLGRLARESRERWWRLSDARHVVRGRIHDVTNELVNELSGSAQ